MENTDSAMRMGIYYVYGLDGSQRTMTDAQVEAMTAEAREECYFARLCDSHQPYALRWTYIPTADGWVQAGHPEDYQEDYQA